MSSAGTSSRASATSSSNCCGGSGFTGGPSPAGRQRTALLVAGRALHPQDSPLVQLVDGPCARVGAGRADAGHDRVDQVLDPRSRRVQVHPRGADTLLEQPGPGPLEARLRRCPGLDRPRRRHAEGLLVEPARAVVVDVAGRLVGAGEPRPDHHVRRPGSQGEGDVPGMPDAAVGPHALAQRAGLRRALLDGGELRTADAGHHPRGAHGARPDALLDHARRRPPPPSPAPPPASIRSRVPSAVTTLPATTGAGPATDRTARTASIAFSWWPCAVSTTSTSTPDCSSADALPATSPLMPTAAEVSSCPSAFSAGR